MSALAFELSQVKSTTKNFSLTITELNLVEWFWNSLFRNGVIRKLTRSQYSLSISDTIYLVNKGVIKRPFSKE